MDQRTRFLPGCAPAGIVGTAAAGSAAAHVVAAALGPAGAMAWWMAGMGIACLACLGPMLPGRLWAGRAGRTVPLPADQAAGRAAGHLLVMGAAMVLVHLVLLVAPGAGGHHGRADTALPSAHGVTMLALIAVELLCLIGASAALRLARRGLHRRRAVTT
ncbi:hypothetical protein ACIPY3_20010 [Paenarthrobacter sp. NPDC089714]|uniref:hypothetical protein n=1 Tax=Paenarthrobacter sp. NPDC089714 TaxID=3364377 RepID=UPI00381EE682